MARDWNQSLQREIKKFNHKDFAEGAMAVCALIAFADGTITGDEKRKVASLITTHSVFESFDASFLQERFNYYCDKLSKEFDFAKVEAIQTITKLKKKEDQARAIVQIGVIIGTADGHFDDSERQVVSEICHALSLDKTQFGL